MVQALRRHADDQPDKEKLLWKRHLSQQADCRAEIHELHTELLNTKERSEMRSHLAANMCRITPDRPTSSGLQSPVGVPVQFGPSPMTREYSATPPGNIQPSQWGDFYGRAGDDGRELFGAVPDGDDSEELCPQATVHQLDELQHHFTKNHW